jgi:NAD(P)-dependent dehydrogenase (short-subunit alcohol dehydrogenase family)
MIRLSGKTAVVTGGGRGLGSAIAIGMAAEGAHVLVVDRNREAADIIVAQIKASGGSASVMTVTGEAGEKFLQRVPLGRVGETHEIAGPAVFLASDMSSYVTGVTIPIDGGYLAL